MRADFHCGIHDEPRPRGFIGCTVYDCFSAGQRVTQDIFAGRDWHREPGIAQAMFDAFKVVRELHELLWYRTQALDLDAARRFRPELEAAREETERLAGSGTEALRRLDVTPHWRETNTLLSRVSETVRGKGRNLRGADLREADLGTALFVTQPQVDSAKGTPSTVLPRALARPAHWMA